VGRGFDGKGQQFFRISEYGYFGKGKDKDRDYFFQTDVDSPIGNKFFFAKALEKRVDCVLKAKESENFIKADEDESLAFVEHCKNIEFSEDIIGENYD